MTLVDHPEFIRDQHLYPLADDLVALVAEHGLDRLARQQDDPVGIDDEHGVGRGLQ